MSDAHRLPDPSQVARARSSACLNCGAPLSGAFCARCGQRDIPPYPSVRELAMDAVTEFSGWDGRLALTLRELVRRPGMLTHEFLEGRRARYISPLRLYLVSSLVYFLLAAAAPNVRLESGKELGLRVGLKPNPDATPSSRPERVANAASGALESGEALSPAERAAALQDIARAPAVMRPFLQRAVEDPGGFRRGMLEAMPRMLFVLLPIFAGIVALFYRGRKYPEHLYFAIHLHAFIFTCARCGRVDEVHGAAGSGSCGEYRRRGVDSYLCDAHLPSRVRRLVPSNVDKGSGNRSALFACGSGGVGGHDLLGIGHGVTEAGSAKEAQ